MFGQRSFPHPWIHFVLNGRASAEGSRFGGQLPEPSGILKHFWDGKAGASTPLTRVPDESINFIGGFDGFVVGNMKEIKRIFDLFGVTYNIICDPSEVWNTPTDGEFRMYEGGTTKETVEKALNAKATIVFQEYCAEKTIKYLKDKGQEVVVLNCPVGVAGTDRFIQAIADLTGKDVPDQLIKERGRLVDAMAELMGEDALRVLDARPVVDLLAPVLDGLGVIL